MEGWSDEKLRGEEKESHSTRQELQQHQDMPRLFFFNIIL